MAFTPTTPELGWQPIGSSSTIQNHPIETIIGGYDSNYGFGEFIYLKGVASTVLGSAVTYGGTATVNSVVQPTGQTTLAAVTAGQAQPVAFATNANLASNWGWYQIQGTAIAATNGTLAAGPGALYLAGSGQLTSSQANGAQLVNARNLTATGTPATAQALITIQRPFAQGQAV